MTLKGEYKAGKSFCIICGHLVLHNTFGATIEGVATTQSEVISLEDLTICNDCWEKITTNVKGGIIAAEVKHTQIEMRDIFDKEERNHNREP